MKLCRQQAIPISGANGIADLERICASEAFDPPAPTRGTMRRHNVLQQYVQHVRKHADLHRPVRIAADMANAMGIVESKALEGLLEIDPLFNELDGTFPNHEANPLNAETLESLQERVRSGSYDFGVAFDGDADRVGFIDEKGQIIPMDIMTALIARDLLLREKGVIFYDLRSSWAVKETIEESGGTPMMSRVGHAFIKQQMRDENAIFAGELSGHYYFRANYYTESSSMAVLAVANIVSRSGKPLSALVAPIRRYFASGELNNEVHDPAAAIERLKASYRDGRMILLDGVSVEYPDWWFNVRASNTEPLIRLNVEARSKAQMESKRDELLAMIRK
jgi:phosphomannomutase